MVVVLIVELIVKVRVLRVGLPEVMVPLVVTVLVETLVGVGVNTVTVLSVPRVVLISVVVNVVEVLVGIVSVMTEFGIVVVTITTSVVLKDVAVTVPVTENTCTDVKSIGLRTVKEIKEDSVTTNATLRVTVSKVVTVVIIVREVVQDTVENSSIVVVKQQAQFAHGHGPPWHNVVGAGPPKQRPQPVGQQVMGPMAGQSPLHCCPIAVRILIKAMKMARIKWNIIVINYAVC